MHPPSEKISNSSAVTVRRMTSADVSTAPDHTEGKSRSVEMVE